LILFFQSKNFVFANQNKKSIAFRMTWILKETRKRLPHNFLILRDELLLCKRERRNEGTTELRLAIYYFVGSFLLVLIYKHFDYDFGLPQCIKH